MEAERQVKGRFQAIGLVAQVRSHTDFLHSILAVDGVDSALSRSLRPATRSHRAEPVAACTVHQCPAISAFSSVGASLPPSLPGSLCAAGLGTQESTRPWPLTALICSMSLFPKAGMCCVESSRSLGELSLFFLLRPLQTNLLCQLREEVRVAVDLIQKEIILCSAVTFYFSRGFNLFVHHGLPGIWDLFLRAGFLQPSSLHSHFSPCCPVLWQPRPTERCRDAALCLWKGNRSLCIPFLLPAAGRALLPSPFSPLHGAGTTRQTLAPGFEVLISSPATREACRSSGRAH